MAPTTFLPTEETLREDFVRDEDERPKVAYDQFSNEIPVISLAGVDGKERDEIRKKIVAACEDWGIFQVVDHGVDMELVETMTKLAKEFFALSQEEKLHFDMSGGKKGGFIVSSHLQVLLYLFFEFILPVFKIRVFFGSDNTCQTVIGQNQRISYFLKPDNMKSFSSSFNFNF